MAWLWARLHTRVNSRTRGEPCERLGYFRGGFQVLVDALVAELLSRGGRVLLGAEARGVRFDAASQRTLVSVAGVEQSFDRVICTVPSNVFVALTRDNVDLAPAYPAQLQSIQYLGAVCCVFSTQQSMLPYYWTNIHDADSPFLVLIQHTNLVGTVPYEGRHVYYLGAYVPHAHTFFERPESEVVEIFLRHLALIAPTFDVSRVERRHLFRFRNAQHVVDCDYEKRIPPYRTPIPGVYLSNFSQIFPEDRGTNFAVREGRKVAALVGHDVTRGGYAPP